MLRKKKKKFCPACKIPVNDSKTQKMERSTVIRLLKLIRVAGIKEKHEETKDMCYDCWKKELRSMMKPYAEQLGKAVEDW